MRRVVFPTQVNLFGGRLVIALTRKMLARIVAEIAQTKRGKIKIPNPKPQISNVKPQTRNPKPETENLKPET